MSYKPGDVIPKLGKVPEDVYEVQEGTCSLCGETGYVFAGMSLSFSDESVMSFFKKYQSQKPLVCQNANCACVYCQNCAREKGQGRCTECGSRLEYL